MGKYSPPYDINNDILSLISSISLKVGQITTTTRLESKPHLRKNNQIKSIHSSLSIEANSLSVSQMRDVINGETVLGDQKEIQEVKNAYEAYERLSSIDPYSIDDLKEIHGIMTKYLVNESGCFRSGEEGVFSGDKCIFMAPPARMVPQLMEDLFSWMNDSKDKVHPLILSAVFHYEFVFIHPFSDGNGRMARLWHTSLLSKWNPVFEYIPLENQIEKFQQQYYDAIASCHKEGKSTTFVIFMLEKIDEVLDSFIQESITEDTCSEQVKKLLSVMDYDIPYTASALMEKLHLKSRDGFRNNYLHPAIKAGLIKMSVPDKPQSKNQRYYKV